MKLVTKRLMLRDLQKDDAPSLVKHLNNLNVSKYLAAVPYPYRMRDAKKFIVVRMKSEQKKPREEYFFAIELREKRGVVGAIAVGAIDRFSKTASIGYWLSEQYWGQKIMTEAVSRVLDFCFNRLKLQRINSYTFVENGASQAVLTKVGFVQEGIARQHTRALATGVLHDVYYYGLLKSEFNKKK